MGQKKLVRKAEPPSKRRIAWPRWTGFRGKTLWDFLQLLIIPLMLAAIGFWFTAQQDARQQQIENQRAEAERELSEQRAQDEALQAYLDQMSDLMLKEDLRTSAEDSEVRKLAQARTATVIQRLDAEGNRNVIRFLDEANLTGAVAEEASPTGYFGQINLLAGADLQGAQLEGVDLSNTDLRFADLRHADLHRANLNAAQLTSADLRHADLRGAYLHDAVLFETQLDEANLEGAEGFTKEMLEQHTRSLSLKGTIMPDGSIHD